MMTPPMDRQWICPGLSKAPLLEGGGAAKP